MGIALNNCHHLELDCASQIPNKTQLNRLWWHTHHRAYPMYTLLTGWYAATCKEFGGLVMEGGFSKALARCWPSSQWLCVLFTEQMSCTQSDCVAGASGARSAAFKECVGLARRPTRSCKSTVIDCQTCYVCRAVVLLTCTALRLYSFDCVTSLLMPAHLALRGTEHCAVLLSLWNMCT